MIIKAKDMLILGGLDEESTLLYDEENNIFYTGKSVKSVNPKKIGLTGVQIIFLYGLVRLLSDSTIFSGIMPLLVGLVLAYGSSWWFIHQMLKWEYEVEVYELSEEALLVFLENQAKRLKPVYYVILFFSVALLASISLFLVTDRFLWFFMTVGFAWCDFTAILSFGKIFYEFKKFYKKVRNA